jgi:hypothetical protein
MSKRIVVFCSDLINTSGPLPAEELGQRVRAAGLTKSINPVTTIRTALRQSPIMVQLPDGRFDSARRMLDGVALTHRVRFATKGRQVLFAGPELAVLDQVLVHEGSLALTAGGLSPRRSGSSAAGAVRRTGCPMCRPMRCSPSGSGAGACRSKLWKTSRPARARRSSDCASCFAGT